MRAGGLSKFRRPWLNLFCLGGMTQAMAQPNPSAEEGLRWMKLRISEINVGTEVEGDWERRSVSNSGQAISRKTIYAVPTLGLGLEGSVYHPNLLEFKLDTESGIGWQETSVNVAGGGSRSDALYLMRYHAHVSILKEKPYAISLFAENEHTTRDYDFFTRATVDQQSQGARLGYTQGPVPFSLMFRHIREEISGHSRPTSLDEISLAFTASNEQSAGNRTDLSYTFNDFSRQEADAYSQDGIYHSASLIDLKTFGDKDWIKLNSSLSYNQQDSDTTPFNQRGSIQRVNKLFSDHEHLKWQHSDQLISDYKYSFNWQDSGFLNSDGHAASASLRHQLFDSLTSTFDLHGQFFSSRGAETAIDTTRYGIGLNEHYTKRLGSWGRITLGYGGLLDREERQTMGQVIFIVGEEHTLEDGVISFLNQPRVNVASIQVWDATGNLLYRPLLDYLVLTHGERTEVRRVAGGLIPNGARVRVDYTATAQPSDSFHTIAHQMQARLDFFNGLVGIYGYLNLQENEGGESIILEDVNDKVIGLDLAWRWFRSGVEYQVYDSNLSPYRTLRLFQNFTIEANEDTTLSLDLGQSWSTFPRSDRDLATYHAIARSRTRLHPSLALNLEGGVRFQDGQGYDQQLATARADLEFRSGKLAVQAGYLYEDETFLEETRLRHFFYLRAKRQF